MAGFSWGAAPSAPAANGGAEGLYSAGHLGATALRGPDAPMLAAEMSEPQALQVLDTLVKREAAFPPGRPLLLDAEERAALILSGQTEGQITLRVTEARAREVARLTAIARGALDVDERLSALKAAWLSQHRACYGYKPSLPGTLDPRRCETACLKAHAAWRRAIEGAQPSRLALAEVRRLSVPVPAKDRVSVANTRVHTLRYRLLDRRAAMHEEQKRHDALRVDKQNKPHHAERVAAATRSLAVLAHEVNAIAVQLAEAEAEHETAQADRVRYEIAALDAVFAAEPTTKKSRKNA